PAVVGREALYAVIGGYHIGHTHLTDTESHDPAEVLLQHHAIAGHLGEIKGRKRALQGRRVRNNDLPKPASLTHRLEPYGPPLEQTHPGAPRVIEAKGRKAGEHGSFQAFRQAGRPAGRSGRPWFDERMRDRFSRDEGIGHNPTEQIVLVFYPERACLLFDERVAWHEVNRAWVTL